MKNTFKIAPLVFAAALLTMGACSNGQRQATENTNQPNAEAADKKAPSDKEFAGIAADGGLLEVRLGELAMTNGTSAEVKELGQMMVTDHTKLNNELTTMARAKNIELPATLSKKSQEKFDHVASKKGAEFDKEYATLMVTAHEEDLAAFKKEAEQGEDESIKQWAGSEVPLLEHHLEVANYAVHPRNSGN